MNDPTQKIHKSDEEWRKMLTPEQYHVTREGGTEAPFSGEYYTASEPGMYLCSNCGNELFSSEHKYESGSGWPSFDRPTDADHVSTSDDTSLGMTRKEVRCNRCGAHLGHVFNDGPTTTGQRFCINSLALKLDKKQT